MNADTYAALPAAAGLRREARVPPGLAVLSIIPLVVLVVPVIALVWRSCDVLQWRQSLHDPVVTKALALSLFTTTITLGLVAAIGSPVAYLLARYQFRGKRVLDAVLDLPMILPPAVAGLALLLAFGRRGLIGGWLSRAGIDVAFSTTAVIIAQCFVSAPFFIRAARSGFESVDPELEHVAASLGEPPREIFRRVTLPLARPSLMAGAIMAWARALGEFGATLMFAGNFPGRTQTMPLAIYTAMESDLGSSLTLGVVLLGVSLVALLALQLALGRRSARAA